MPAKCNVEQINFLPLIHLIVYMKFCLVYKFLLLIEIKNFQDKLLSQEKELQKSQKVIL